MRSNAVFRGIFAFVLCLILLAVLPLGAHASGGVPRRVLDRRESVVRVEVYNGGVYYGHGSGFVIKNDAEGTYIATSHHVAGDPGDSYLVWVSATESVDAEIAFSSVHRDLAVLRLAWPVPTLSPIPVVDAERVKQGDAVYASGFPGVADSLAGSRGRGPESVIVTNGIVSGRHDVAIDASGRAISVIQVTAAINAGNSGGPLLNSRGQVIGISTFSMLNPDGTAAEATNGAVSSNELIHLAIENGLKLPGASVFSTPLVIGIIVVVAAAIPLGLMAGKRRAFLAGRRKPAATQTDSAPEGEDPPHPPAAAPGIYILPRTTQDDPSDGQAEAAPETPAQRKRLGLLLGIGIPALLLVAAVAFFGYHYIAFNSDYADGDFSGAAAHTAYAGFLVDPYDQLIVDLNVALGYNDFSAASALAEGLPATESADWKNLISYRRAEQLVREGDYENAIAIMKELSLLRYGDADDRLKEYRFGYATVLWDAGRFEESVNLLINLKNLQYQPAAELLGAIKEPLYYIGIEAYRDGNLKFARSVFQLSAPYERSGDYTTLINARLAPSAQVYNPALIGLFDFEDTADHFFSVHAWSTFLEGRWATESGGNYLIVKADGAITYTLPTISGEYYYVEDDHFTIDGEKWLKFTIFDRDTIEIYNYVNKKTYTMYRK